MRYMLATRRTLLCTLAMGTSMIGALAVVAPKASADVNQCPYNSMCIWSGTYYSGQFSYWPASDTGCHTHVGNPNIRSAFNRMNSYTVRVGGWGQIGALSGQPFYPQNVTGDVCWPSPPY